MPDSKILCVCRAGPCCQRRRLHPLPHQDIPMATNHELPHTIFEHWGWWCRMELVVSKSRAYSFSTDWTSSCPKLGVFVLVTVLNLCRCHGRAPLHAVDSGMHALKCTLVSSPLPPQPPHPFRHHKQRRLRVRARVLTWPSRAAGLCSMVLFYTPRESGYIIYVGRDKHENEELLKYGWETDVWFHVDKVWAWQPVAAQREGGGGEQGVGGEGRLLRERFPAGRERASVVPAVRLT